MLRIRLRACFAAALILSVTTVRAEIAIPNLWDRGIRIEKPDLGPPRVVRFLTDDEYPPLHFATPEGGLTGFSVELARAACEKLGLACTIQARRFDTLLDSLGEGRGDVLAAAIPLTPELRRRFAASHLYHRSPARFLTTRGNAVADLDPEALRGRRVALIAGSAHAAFIERFLPFVQARPARDLPAALGLLASGDAEYVFGDGVALSLTLAGRAGSDYAFTGGPFLAAPYFGEGVAFLLRPEDAILRRALDYALQALWDDGTYARIYLRFFPVSPFQIGG